LQQEGAYALARQQLELALNGNSNDVDMMRRVAELSVAIAGLVGSRQII